MLSGVLGGALLHGIPHAQWLHQAWETGLLLVVLTPACSSALMSLPGFAPRLKVSESRSLPYFDHIARRYSNPRKAPEVPPRHPRRVAARASLFVTQAGGLVPA